MSLNRTTTYVQKMYLIFQNDNFLSKVNNVLLKFDFFHTNSCSCFDDLLQTVDHSCCHKMALNHAGVDVNKISDLLWNKALWLDVASHVTTFNQSECINSSHSRYLMTSTLGSKLLHVLTNILIIKIALVWSLTEKKFQNIHFHLISWSQTLLSNKQQ